VRMHRGSDRRRAGGRRRSRQQIKEEEKTTSLAEVENNATNSEGESKKTILGDHDCALPSRRDPAREKSREKHKNEE